MSNRKISAALSTHLNSMPGGVPIAFENSGYTPIIGTTWIRESFLPANTATVGIGDDDSNDFRGIYQISIYTPAGASKYEAHQLVDQISTYFARGIKLTFESQSVKLTRVDVAQGMVSGAWYMTPVSVRYRGFADNG
jgi:hypothetical protein